MSDNAVKGFVHSIETFGSVDGPGVRFVIFLSGCAMRCQFCHNPDTWKHDENTVEYTADELLNKALAYRPYWKNKGGITVSGGEPLLQIDFLLDLFKKAKKQGVNTCIDTSANPFTTKEPFYSKWKELMEYTDLLLLDIKHIDNEQHKILTGQPNTNILEMARQLSDMGKPVWIRHVLVPERNDKDEYLFRLADFIRSLKNVERVEVLPYHTLGVYKWKALGYDYPLEGINPPTKERVKNAEMILNGEKQEINFLYNNGSTDFWYCRFCFDFYLLFCFCCFSFSKIDESKVYSKIFKLSLLRNLSVTFGLSTS